MTITRITLHVCTLPFRFAYGHARKTHRATTAILAVITDAAGRIGIGEAVPRDYVTGETPASVLRDAAALARPLLGATFRSSAEIDRQMRALRTEGVGPQPSCALCCLDLALHDLAAQAAGVNMAAFLGAAPRPLAYTASIGLKNRAQLGAVLLLYRALGFTALKLKVGDAHDADRLRIIRNLMGREIRIHADANGAWTPETAPRKVEMLAKYGVWAIEEPLPIPMGAVLSTRQHDREAALDDAHFAAYAQLRREIGLPVILDESCISERTLDLALAHQAADGFNLRLSKLGGYSLSGDLLRKIPPDRFYGFGAMAGESAILAAAGYFWGCAHPGAVFMQGFSHALLHRQQIAAGAIMRRGGAYQLTAPERSGLGLRPDLRVIEQLSSKRIDLS